MVKKKKIEKTQFFEGYPHMSYWGDSNNFEKAIEEFEQICSLHYEETEITALVKDIRGNYEEKERKKRRSFKVDSCSYSFGVEWDYRHGRQGLRVYFEEIRNLSAELTQAEKDAKKKKRKISSDLAKKRKAAKASKLRKELEDLEK